MVAIYSEIINVFIEKMNNNPNIPKNIVEEISALLKSDEVISKERLFEILKEDENLADGEN